MTLLYRDFQGGSAFFQQVRYRDGIPLLDRSKNKVPGRPAWFQASAASFGSMNAHTFTSWTAATRVRRAERSGKGER